MKNLPPTPLKKIDIFSVLSRAYVKDESANPFGTIKDRRNTTIIREADRLKIDKLVLITSGNNGYSLAKMAEGTSLKVVCIVNRSLDRSILSALQEVAYQVIELNLDEKILRPEEMIAFAREREDEVIWDVTNGYEDGYIPVIGEVYSQLDQVNYFVVPVGSGGIFVGIIEALERLRKDAKVIGVGTQSPYQSIADKLSTPWTPYAKAIENYSKDGHCVFRLNEQEIRSTFQKFQHVVTCEPSSAVIFSAPEKFAFKESDTIVFVNSGRAPFH